MKVKTKKVAIKAYNQVESQSNTSSIILDEASQIRQKV